MTEPDVGEAAPSVDSTSSRDGAVARRRLFTDAYALMASTGLNALAGVVTYLLSARLFPDQVVGAAAGMTAAMLLISGIGQLDLTNALHRYLPTAASRAKRVILGSYGAAALASLVLAAGYVLVFGSLIKTETEGAIIWFTAAVVIWTLFNLQDQVFFGLGAAWAVPVDNIIHGLARIGLLLLAVGGGSFAIFATWVVPAAVLIVAGSVLIWFKLLPDYLKRNRKRQSDYSLGSYSRFAAGGYIGGISALVLGNLLPLLVVAHLGVAANAYFYMAWTVASTVDLLVFNFGASLVVQGATNAEHIPYLIKSALKKQAALFIAPLILLAALSYVVLDLAFGRNYADAAWLMLTLLAVGLIPRLLWGVYLPAVRLAGNVKAIVISQTLTNVSVLAASIAGLYLGGLTGIGIGYLIAQVVIAAVCGPKLRAMLKNGFSVKRIDDVSVTGHM